METASKLLSESWPLLLSGVAVMIYMRLDQVMLAAMAGDVAVGEFSAALRIAEVWYFIPMAIMTAAFPALLKKRAQGSLVYRRYLQGLYDGMAWLGFAVAIVTTLSAGWLVPLLYGPAFAHTASILGVQIWAGVAVAMSFVHGKWLLAEGLQKYGLVYTVAGACVNVSLNLIFIPRYGALGSAWATLITQVGLLPIQLIFPKARANFALMILTLTAPYRVMRAFRSVHS
jgi:O-antigen/teichoic acid export membrane protein